MTKRKTVPVEEHKRRPPNTPPSHPKTVPVEEHKRRKPC